MKKISLSGIVVGKSSAPVWKDRVKTEEKKYWIQLLSVDKEDSKVQGETDIKATLYDIKVTPNVFNQAVAGSADEVEIDVKETEVDGKLYYSELEIK